MSRICPVPLANAAVAAGIFVYIQNSVIDISGYGEGLRGDMNATEYRERYQKIQNLDSRGGGGRPRECGGDSQEGCIQLSEKRAFEAFTRPWSRTCRWDPWFTSAVTPLI